MRSPKDMLICIEDNLEEIQKQLNRMKETVATFRLDGLDEDVTDLMILVVGLGKELARQEGELAEDTEEKVQALLATHPIHRELT